MFSALFAVFSRAVAEALNTIGQTAGGAVFSILGIGLGLVLRMREEDLRASGSIFKALRNERKKTTHRITWFLFSLRLHRLLSP